MFASPFFPNQYRLLPLAVLIWRRHFNPTLTRARGAVAKPFFAEREAGE